MKNILRTTPGRIGLILMIYLNMLLSGLSLGVIGASFEMNYYDYSIHDVRPMVSGTTEWQDVVLDLIFNCRYLAFIVLIFAALLMVMFYIALLCTAARKPHSEDLHKGYFDYFPNDLTVAGFIGILCVSYGILLLAQRYEDVVAFIIFVLLILFISLAFLGASMHLASQIKQGKMWRNTLVVMFFRGIGKLISYLSKHFHAVWKVLLMFFAIGIYEVFVTLVAMFCIGALFDGSIAILLILPYVITRSLLFVALLSCAIYASVAVNRLEKRTNELATGNLDQPMKLGGLSGNYRKIGENLNLISDGMQEAVEGKLKSERFKTELITNVSHDIKTPLTSIINYSDLIQKENSENEKIQEYAAVLNRQSVKLKRLIEDLVEASKASTGNLEVNMVPCDAGVFLTQAIGEYEEKLAMQNLELVVKQIEHTKPIQIMADGRRMWRVFDNLMNNICKYAQPGTRVYLTLEADKKFAIITFKNTSRAPLDMTEEQLMERFTRGDASRHTEGSGLGLSIARSMTELQNGTLKLDIDGDLFKAKLAFPRIES